MYHKFEFPAEPDGEEQIDWSPTRSSVRYTGPPQWLGNSTDSSAAARSARKLPFLRNQTHNDTRMYHTLTFPSDYWDNPPWDSSPVVATCYTCGYNPPYIPTNPLCHDVFDSQGWRARSMQRFFRSTCYYNWNWSWHNVVAKQRFIWHGGEFDKDTSRKLQFLGGVLDVSRGFWILGRYTTRLSDVVAVRHSGSTTTRFLKLERLLRHHKDRCISSPHASLTPLARVISLFARYHVCVSW